MRGTEEPRSPETSGGGEASPLPAPPVAESPVRAAPVAPAPPPELEPFRAGEKLPGGRRRILVVDDRPEVRELLQTYLSEQGYEVHPVGSALEALPLLGEKKFHVVLSDILMPEMDGIELLVKIKEKDPDTEVIMITALRELDTALKALRGGAFDFLTKPMNLDELGLTVERAIEHRELLLENRRYHDYLEREVEKRTRELDRITLGLIAALEKANDYKDIDMGVHIRRVCALSEILARGLGLDEELTDKIRRFASLHDIGKVGIRDSILKKPGKLTPDEFEEMKEHTRIGHEILRSANADPVALNIVLCHHERYGGGGYPSGLKGDQIPIEARVVSLADAYDAMTSERCYKVAYSEEKADEIIREEWGKQFDPRIVRVFFNHREEILTVKKRFVGWPNSR